MARDTLSSGRVRRGWVVFFAMAMVLTGGLLLVSPARATFQGAAVVLTPSVYTGGFTYVPGEQMTVTAYATVGDVLDFQFWNPIAGVPTSSPPSQTVGSSGQVVVHFTIPTTGWPDGATYQVHVTDTTSGQVQNRPFAIQTYDFLVWSDRNGYLPGDQVTIGWSETSIKDGSPAPDGVGQLQAYLDTGASLLSPNYSFSTSQGSYAFTLPTTTPIYHTATVYAWLNDTAVPPIRPMAYAFTFRVGNLRIGVGTDQGTYNPGGIVTVTVTSRVQRFPGGPQAADPYEPGVNVNVTVADPNGTAVSGYAATNLVSDYHGQAIHVFALLGTAATGTYAVTAAATAHGVISVSQGTSFQVATQTIISAVLSLDKAEYLAGDTIQATAAASPTGTYTYSWWVYDVTNGVQLLTVKSGTPTSFTYTIASTFQGQIRVIMVADDGLGHTSPPQSQTVNVAFAYMAIGLDRSEYNPGDTITASFSLTHAPGYFTSPSYFYQVVDNNGNLVASGPASGSSVSYQAPAAPSPAYTFTVTASQDGRSVSASASILQASGYLLGISLDKTSYVPGDTIHMTYTVTARGTASLPLQYHFIVFLYGVVEIEATTTGASGSLSLAIPGGTSNGDLLLFVVESHTGASTYQTVHIGAVNPLLTDVGGLPMVDWLLLLLVVVLILAVVLLWRRMGMGAGPKPPKAASAPAPPPPPGGPQPPQAAGPMSVTCSHCGKPIEITTSKRPIEVMCPSCGETQVVQ